MSFQDNDNSPMADNTEALDKALEELKKSTPSDEQEISSSPFYLNINDLSHVPVQVSVVLGSVNMSIQQLLKLGRGAVIELHKRIGEPIDIYVNNRLVARGEVVVVNEKSSDATLGVTLTEIVKLER